MSQGFALETCDKTLVELTLVLIISAEVSLDLSEKLGDEVSAEGVVLCRSEDSHVDQLLQGVALEELDE